MEEAKAGGGAQIPIILQPQDFREATRSGTAEQPQTTASQFAVRGCLERSASRRRLEGDGDGGARILLGSRMLRGGRHPRERAGRLGDSRSAPAWQAPCRHLAIRLLPASRRLQGSTY